MGAAWETISFILHTLGSHDQQSSAYAVGHLILFLLAPLWINAFVYMTLSRMVHMMIPDRRVLRIPSTVISKLFVWADVATFIVQAAGGSMTSPGSDANTLKWGMRIYMIGMGLQEGAILGFLSLMIAFQLKMRELEASGAAYTTLEDAGPAYQVALRRWKGVFYALYAVLGAITVRRALVRTLPSA